jgi:putative FmdB family regulatory protein
MPIYEYKCDACGTRFEQIQKFSDPPIDVCPNCGERKVHKLLSSPAIQFKGSGWYITDYARAKDGKGAEAKESGKSSESGESVKSGEPKAAGESGKSKETGGAGKSKESGESKSSAAPSTSSSKDG